MERGKKIIFIPHCFLNQNAKALGREVAQGSVKEIMDVLTESDIGIVQMSCPQLEYNGGLNRKAKDKAAYDKKAYRSSCKRLSLNVLNQIEKYMAKKYTIVGVMGVEFTPSCAVHQLRNGNRSVPGKGIFMEEFETVLKKKKFQVPIIGVDLNNIFSSSEKLRSLIGSC